MNLRDLTADLLYFGIFHGNDLVMVRAPDGTMFSLKSVESETHEDADGSTTVWLNVEEY